LDTKITANTASITSETTRAIASENALDTKIASNTASITNNTNAITANTTSIATINSRLTSATANNIPNTLVLRDVNGNFSAGTLFGTLSGTATAANKLTIGGTISTSGDVSYTSSLFDGMGNVTGIATLTNTSVTSGTYGTLTSIPSITIDSKGRITSAVTNNIPSASSTITGLLSNIDWSTFNNKQGALTAGSGISIVSGTISATGLTSNNIANNAGITNVQLANSNTTLGLTTMSLGGTYTNVTGLSSLTSTNVVVVGTSTSTSGLQFSNINSNSIANSSSNKVLTLDATGNVLLTNVPGTQNIVSFNTASPNSGGPTFTPPTPADQSVIYQSSVDNSLWTYNGTTYVTYNAPSITEWYLKGSTNDAGSNKSSSIYRPGGIIAGGGSTSVSYGNLTAIGGTSFSGSVPYGVASIGNITNGSWTGNGFLFSNTTSGNNSFSAVVNNDKIYQGWITPSNTSNTTSLSNGTGWIFGNNISGSAIPVNALATYDASAQTSNYTSTLFNATNTSSTASITKTGLAVSSTGTWNGSGATNIGLAVNATGGTTNYAATFNGGNVGIGTITPGNSLEIKGAASSSGLRFTNLTSASTASGASSKVLGLNSSGDVVLTNVPGTQNIVTFSVNANPNTLSPTTLFSPNQPTDLSVIYQSSIDNSFWTYNDISYVTYTPPTSTPFYLTGTSNDAGNNKTTAIHRTASITVDNGFLQAQSASSTYQFTIDPTNIIGPRLQLGSTAGTINQFFEIGAYNSQNNFDSKGRDLQFFGNSGNSNGIMLKAITGYVGINTTTPTSMFQVNDATAQTTNYISSALNASATSSTASITKTGLAVSSTGTWNGTGATNIGLAVNATGGTTNYAATFNGGNVGIGTNAPANNLDVVGGLNMRNIIGANGSGYGIEFNTNSNAPRIDWVYNGAYIGEFASDANDFLLKNSKLATGGFQFYTNVSGSGTSKMTITNAGNVGIGNTAPYSLLSNTSSNIIGSDTKGENTPSISWINNIGAGYTAAFYNSYTSSGTSNGVAIKVGTNSSTSIALDVSYGASQATNGTPLFDVLGNGNVGIGTYAATSKFQVNDATAQAANYISSALNATATSSTASISKTGLAVSSTGNWNGTGATNTGVSVNVSGGTTNYAATFNGGNVGIGIATPVSSLEVVKNSLYTGTETDGHGIQISTGRTPGTDYTLYMGVDNTNKFGYLQSVKWGTSFSPIVLNGRGGNVGIGSNSSPNSKLEVNGAATNTVAYNASAGTTIDFSLSNLAYTSTSPAAFILTNIKDGGTYTLAVQGTTAGTSSFTSNGFTFLSTNNGLTTAGKQTLYTFMVMGTTVYFYMATGF
jgi:hypothetical protein